MVDMVGVKLNCYVLSLLTTLNLPLPPLGLIPRSPMSIMRCNHPAPTYHTPASNWDERERERDVTKKLDVG